MWTTDTLPSWGIAAVLFGCAGSSTPSGAGTDAAPTAETAVQDTSRSQDAGTEPETRGPVETRDGADVAGPDEAEWVSEAPGRVAALAVSDGTALWVARAEGQATLYSGAAAQALGSVPDDNEFELTARVVVEEGLVFWTSPRATGVWRTPIGGGETTHVIGTGQEYGLAAGGGYVWWSEHSKARVMRSPIDPPGAAPEEFALVGTPTGLVYDDGSLWVLDRLASTILRYDVAGGDPEVHAIFTGDNTMRLFGGPEHLVWCDNSNGRLLAVGKGPGSDVQVIGQNAATMDGKIAVTAGAAFVAPAVHDLDHTVRGFPLDGKDPVLVFDPGAECASQVAAGDPWLYFSDCAGRIWRTSL